MIKTKKILSLLLALILVGAMFAGCSKVDKGQTTTITGDTLLIAYSDSNSPFFEASADGKTFKGFEVNIIEKIFDNIKEDCKNYAFVKVDKDYRLGEDTAYTDEDGKTYIAYMAVGGIAKNTDTNNEDYSFSQSTISDRIITVTGKNSKIKTYADFSGAKVGTVSLFAKNALSANKAISSVCKSTTEYKDIKTALADLNSGKIDAVVTDELSYRPQKAEKTYNELSGELDTIEYGFATAKYDRLKDDINEAIYELKSPNYNDKDEFTPIVQQYFGYNASSFEYTPPQK